MGNEWTWGAVALFGIALICVALAGCTSQPEKNDWMSLTGTIPFDGTIQIMK